MIAAPVNGNKMCNKFHKFLLSLQKQSELPLDGPVNPSKKKKEPFKTVRIGMVNQLRNAISESDSN